MDLRLLTTNRTLYEKLNELDYFGETRITNSGDIRNSLSIIANTLSKYPANFSIETLGNTLLIKKRNSYLKLKIYFRR
jgi:hypothetical protein